MLQDKVVRASSLHYRPELDGLRAVAVLIVVLHHMNLLGGVGFLGVDVFFVLSGYLISSILIRMIDSGVPLRHFYQRRFARLYPGLIINVILVSLLMGIDEFTDFKPFWASLFYFKNFLHWGDTFGPMWSLSAEEQFYFIFPWILLLGLRNFRAKLPFMLTSYIAVVWAIAIATSAPRFIWNMDGVFSLVVFRPTMIILGVLTALWYPKLRELASARSMMWMACLILILVADWMIRFPPLAGLTTVLLILGCDAAVTSNSASWSWVQKFLSFPVLVWIGLLSYSIYIWHFPIIELLLKAHYAELGFGNPFSVPPHLVFGAFLWILPIAAISFYGIERPLLKRFSPKAQRSRVGDDTEGD